MPLASRQAQGLISAYAKGERGVRLATGVVDARRQEPPRLREGADAGAHGQGRLASGSFRGRGLGRCAGETDHAPDRRAPQRAAYAFIVGIDAYRDVPRAPGAKADAERFAELARRTLGLKEEHIRVALEDHATKQDVERALAWLENETPAGGRIYFFFRGHGRPARLNRRTWFLTTPTRRTSRARASRSATPSASSPRRERARLSRWSTPASRERAGDPSCLRALAP